MSLLEEQRVAAGYRPDIDALRAIAVLGVLAFHAFPETLAGGFVGVDVFFVVSGFLISGILWRSLEDGRFSLREFYRRRARRILPALLLVLTAALLAGWFLLLPLEYAALGNHVLGAATFTSNFVLWSEAGYFDAAAETKPLLHLWSLAIEEQFYLVWPLVMFAARRRRVPLAWLCAAVLVISFAASAVATSKNPDAAFYTPATRVWELALGGLLVPLSANLQIRDRLRDLMGIAGAVVIGGSMFVLSRLTPFPGWAALLPTLGTFLFILAGADAWPNRTIARSRVIVFVGLVSYPLYLWHWPLLAFARLLSIGTPAESVRAGALAIAFLAASATYLLLERPIRGGHHHAVLPLAGVTVGLSAFALFLVVEKGVASRIPEPLRTYVSVPYPMNAGVNMACWPSGNDPTYPDSCLDGAKPGPAVFLWGDSHAARLSPGLRRVLGDPARMAQYTRSSCPPLLDHGTATCQVANAFVLGKIRESQPEIVLLFANWLQHGSAWTPASGVGQRLDATLRAITNAGAGRVVLLGPVPQWRGDLPRLLALATFRDPSRKVPTRMTFGLEPAAKEIDEALAVLVGGREHVTYVSAVALLCDASGCLTRIDDTADGLVTWDHGHLTTKGAEHLAHPLVAKHLRPE